MSGTHSHSKTKDRRLKENGKIEAEVERSMSVVKMKQAHKLTVDTEKLRKRSALQSICERVGNHVENIQSLAGLMHQSTNEYPPTQGTVFGEAIESVVRIYESIRYDIQKTLEIKDEDLETIPENAGQKRK